MINVEINSKLTKKLQYKYKMIFAREEHKKTPEDFSWRLLCNQKCKRRSEIQKTDWCTGGGIFIATALPLQAIPASPFPVFSNAQSLAPRF